MYIFNGQRFDVFARQLVGDVQYPAGWFADSDRRSDVGIVEIPEPAAPSVTEMQIAVLEGFDFVDGIWQARWLVRNLTSEELAEAAAQLLVRINAAVNQTYRDVDSVYDAAIGKREPEYRDAETAARAYVVAGYAGEVDQDVSDFAINNPTGQVQTNAWAADQIIARADAFRTAQKAMRSMRFASQAEMRAAETVEQLAVAATVWDGFIASTRTQLGL